MPEDRKLDGKEALQRLVHGNRRFLMGVKSINSLNHTANRIRDLSKNGQSPFAIILGCADSRVPAEIIFDQGLGDLFVVRVAGNVVTPSILASIEYAAEQFKAPLCVVLGHSACGAVTVALQRETQEHLQFSPSIEKLISKVRRPVRKAMARMAVGAQPAAIIDSAVVENVNQSVKSILKKSDALNQLQKNGSFLLVGAVYDLSSGKVDFMIDQNELDQTRKTNSTDGLKRAQRPGFFGETGKL